MGSEKPIRGTRSGAPSIYTISYVRLRVFWRAPAWELPYYGGWNFATPQKGEAFLLWAL